MAGIVCILARKKCEFTDKEIDDERRKLAKQWNQTISQVLDEEALHYLRQRATPGVR